MNRISKLSVSLMCADLVNLERDIHILEENGVDYLHVDIMDAAFVPNLTFGPDVVNSIRKITSLPVDIHLRLYVAIQRNASLGLQTNIGMKFGGVNGRLHGNMKPRARK